VSSSTRLLVLGVVRIFQPVHGYDVRRELLGWRANEWANVAPGSIYNALKTLTKDGLIEVVGTGAIGGRPERTSYRLTPDGEKEFQALLRETWWSVAEPVDPLAPAIAFMWAMRRDELVAALKHRVANVKGKMISDQYAIEYYDDPYSKDQVREMIRLGTARVGAEIAWAEALIEKLEQGEYTFADERKPAEKAQHAAVHDRKRAAARPDKKRRAPGARRGRG
jgi:DNA-binding PadR family transcriptional regulator